MHLKLHFSIFFFHFNFIFKLYSLLIYFDKMEYHFNIIIIIGIIQNCNIAASLPLWVQENQTAATPTAPSSQQRWFVGLQTAVIRVCHLRKHGAHEYRITDRRRCSAALPQCPDWCGWVLVSCVKTDIWLKDACCDLPASYRRHAVGQLHLRALPLNPLCCQ